MEAVSSNKPYIYEQKNKKDTARIITGIACASIPVVHSLASGIITDGNVAAKTGAALSTAKWWGFFLVGAKLFNKAATSIINNVKPLKSFSEDHPGLTSIGIMLGSVKAGRSAAHYGNKALTKLLGNKTFKDKVDEILQKSSILKNETLGKVVNSVSNFAKGKGRFLGPVALLGLGVLFIKDLFTLGKMDYQISKTK